MGRSALAELLGAMEEKNEKQISKEGQIARLREAEVRFTSSDVPFKVGDLVTPRADGIHKSHGEPNIIVEVRHGADYHLVGDDPGMAQFGQRLNVRVLSVSHGCVVAHWCEAAYLEPYTGPVE